MERSTGDRINELFRKIDERGKLENIRRETASLLVSSLEARRATLDPWEKMHFEMAIALLPTVWLRLALTHVQMALEPPDERTELDPDKAREFGALSAEELIARLKRYTS